MEILILLVGNSKLGCGIVNNLNSTGKQWGLNFWISWVTILRRI